MVPGKVEPLYSLQSSPWSGRLMLSLIGQDHLPLQESTGNEVQHYYFVTEDYIYIESLKIKIKQ